MRCINITNGKYLNDYLQNKYNEIFIPFNEAMIQGDLLYPLFDEKFINYRSTLHNVSYDYYLDNLNDFISIRNYINDIDKIVLWFGEDAFCIINLLTVLTYLEELNYNNKIILNIVDDITCNVLISNIKIDLHCYKEVYINLINRTLIKTDNDIIYDGLKDYLYITSNNNHIIDYIKNNKDLSKEKLLINIMDNTYKYGLSDVFIMSLINKYI